MFIFIDELTLILGVSALCVWWFVTRVHVVLGTDTVGLGGLRVGSGPALDGLCYVSVGLEVGGVTVRLVRADFTSQNINLH